MQFSSFSFDHNILHPAFSKPISIPPIPENNPPTECISKILTPGLLKMAPSYPVAILILKEIPNCRQGFPYSVRCQPRQSLLHCRYINLREEKQEQNFFSLDSSVRFCLIDKLEATPPAITKVLDLFFLFFKNSLMATFVFSCSISLIVF